jgi:hypothetical protein
MSDALSFYNYLLPDNPYLDVYLHKTIDNAVYASPAAFPGP